MLDKVGFDLGTNGIPANSATSSLQLVRNLFLCPEFTIAVLSILFGVKKAAIEVIFLKPTHRKFTSWSRIQRKHFRIKRFDVAAFSGESGGGKTGRGTARVK